MICPNCKAELLEDSLFCHKCGQRVDVKEDDTGDWVKKYYVDNFQNPTSKWYITTKQLIPTNDFASPASPQFGRAVQFVVDKKDVWLSIYLAGMPAERYIGFSQNFYRIELLTKSGEKASFSGQISDQNRICITNEKLFVSFLLKESQPFKVHVSKIDSMIPAQYLFEIDPHGFEKLYNG